MCYSLIINVLLHCVDCQRVVCVVRVLLYFIVINNGGPVDRGIQKVVIVNFYCYFIDVW